MGEGCCDMNDIDYTGDPRAVLIHFNPNHDPKTGQFSKKRGGNPFPRYNDKRIRTGKDRYVYDDGSLTPEGEKRYSAELRKNKLKKKDQRVKPEDEETVLLSGMNTHLGTGTDEQRTDIQGGTALVGGNPLLVQAYHLLHHLREELGADLRHHDATAGALQTGCILVDTEDAHLAVRTTVGLQTFECLLTVVQTGGCHVEVQILVGANFDFR